MQESGNHQRQLIPDTNHDNISNGPQELLNLDEFIKSYSQNESNCIPEQETLDAFNSKVYTYQNPEPDAPFKQ